MFVCNGLNLFGGYFVGDGMFFWWGGVVMLYGIVFVGGEVFWY